jgi:hypothetical protein
MRDGYRESDEKRRKRRKKKPRSGKMGRLAKFKTAAGEPGYSSWFGAGRMTKRQQASWWQLNLLQGKAAAADEPGGLVRRQEAKRPEKQKARTDARTRNGLFCLPFFPSACLAVSNSPKVQGGEGGRPGFPAPETATGRLLLSFFFSFSLSGYGDSGRAKSSVRSVAMEKKFSWRFY